MPETYRHSVSVAGVVVREDGRILVIRRLSAEHRLPDTSPRPTFTLGLDA